MSFSLLLWHFIAMKWASSISEESPTSEAFAAVRAAIEADLGACAPDLAIVFASPHHNAGVHNEIAAWRTDCPGLVVIGCTARGVVGDGHEVEQRRGLSAIAASLPGVQVRATHIENNDLPGDDETAWHAQFGAADDAPMFIVLSDAFTFEPQAFASSLDRIFAGSVTIGGIASGAQAAGAVRLHNDAGVHNSGAVVAVLRGAVRIDTVVAQGCRPIGEPMLVTEHRDNKILALAGQKPVTVLRDLYRELNARDRKLFEHSLFVGIEMQDRVEYQTGDFLVRHIIGTEADSGAVIVNASLSPWQVVQFHLRDARTSRADLEAVLRRFNADHPDVQPAGALMFSCLGRGLHLYQRPDHDTDLFREHFGDVPLGGFFCNGEIGPVGGQTFLHGYTSVFALFSPTSGKARPTEQA
jgi:small ligand-binding sensory domain FIST